MVEKTESMIRRGLRQGGFPLRFVEYDPEESFVVKAEGEVLEETELRQASLDWYLETLKDFEDWISRGESAYLCGPVGTGKTGFVCSLAREAVRLWIQSGGNFHDAPLFVLGGKLGDIVKTGRLSDEVKSARSCLFTSGFLVIDDLFKAPNYDEALRFLDNILRTRWNNKLSTVLTGQVSEDEIGKHLTDSIADLISDYQIITVPGLSRRGQ